MHVVLLLNQLFSDKKKHLSPRFPKGRFESIHILPSDHWKYGNLLKKLALLKFQGFIFFVCLPYGRLFHSNTLKLSPNDKPKNQKTFYGMDTLRYQCEISSY